MKRAILMAAILCLAAPAAAAGPNMTDGQWEVTMKMDMPGLPFAMPPIVYKSCITSKDAVPRQQDKNQECTTSNTEVTGDTVAWVVDCTDKKGNKTHSTGRITYRQDTFDGTVIMATVPARPGDQPMAMKMTGRRIGACP